MSSPAKRNFPIGKPILEIDSISLRFGGVKAITNTSFNVLQHEIRAIIGPNGAGKSSLLNCINGIYKPQEGTIKFRGQILEKITPNTVAQNGVSRTFQNLALLKAFPLHQLQIIFFQRTPLRLNHKYFPILFFQQ